MLANQYPSGTEPNALSQHTEVPSFDILCGRSKLAESFTNRLVDKGLRADKEASIKLIIDVQRGFALDTLRKLRHSHRHRSSKMRIAVVTFSFCPEYWEDLWDLHPDALVVDAGYEHNYEDIIYRVARGEQYRSLPIYSSTLNTTERKVLSSVARGLSNKQIADELTLQEKTVTNALTRIYKKLRLKSRTQAMLYYWSIWHTLDGAPADISSLPAQQAARTL